MWLADSLIFRCVKTDLSGKPWSAIGSSPAAAEAAAVTAVEAVAVAEAMAAADIPVRFLPNNLDYALETKRESKKNTS
jgi:hypothetical protein